MGSELIIKRRVTRLAWFRSKEEPVIPLEGPRASGESTTIRALAEEYKTQVFDFDNPLVRENVERDPELYTADEGKDVPILIDEYQRVPAILDAIKARGKNSWIQGRREIQILFWKC